MSPQRPVVEPPYPGSIRARGGRRHRAPRPPLTVDGIVDTAFAIMARDGYEAVTMRSVARELGTGPASLYAHIDGKRQLDALVVDRVAAEVVVPDPDPARWQEQLSQVGRDLRSALLRHPGVARAVIGDVPTGTEAMMTSERVLAILLRGGVAPQVAAWACDLLPLYVTAVAFEETVGHQQLHGPNADEFVAQLRTYFQSLPADRFPNVVAQAALLTNGSGDDRFEFGLRVLLAGIASVSASWPAANSGA